MAIYNASETHRWKMHPLDSISPRHRDQSLFKHHISRRTRKSRPSHCDHRHIMSVDRAALAGNCCITASIKAVRALPHTIPSLHPLGLLEWKSPIQAQWRQSSPLSPHKARTKHRPSNERTTTAAFATMAGFPKIRSKKQVVQLIPMSFRQPSPFRVAPLRSPPQGGATKDDDLASVHDPPSGSPKQASSCRRVIQDPPGGPDSR